MFVPRATGEGYGYPNPVPPSPPSESGRVNTAASYTNYYDFLINEGSYKFWAVFQVSDSTSWHEHQPSSLPRCGPAVLFHTNA